MTLPLKSANESHNSNFLVRADGLAVRSLRTESPKASDWEFKAVGLAMKTNWQIDGSSAKNRRIVILPSHFHIEPFKPLCTGHLKNVRENECPSRYPHIFGRTYFHPKMAWGLEAKKVRETWGRTDVPHVSWALCTSAFQTYNGRKGGTFWCSLPKRAICIISSAQRGLRCALVKLNAILSHQY